MKMETASYYELYLTDKRYNDLVRAEMDKRR